FARDAVPRPEGLDRLPRRNTRRHPQTHLYGWRRAPQLNGPPCSQRGREALEEPECASHPRRNRRLDARANLVAARLSLASHSKVPSITTVMRSESDHPRPVESAIISILLQPASLCQTS